jgi:long-chain acyl-CoA synthetase
MVGFHWYDQMKSKVSPPELNTVSRLTYQQCLDNVQNIYQLQKLFFRNFAESNCFGSRGEHDQNYQFLTYSDVDLMITHLSAGLLHLGIVPQQIIAIFTRNRYEYHLVCLAAIRKSMIVLPMDDSINSDEFAHRLNEMEVTTLFCGLDEIETVLKYTPKCKFLTKVIHFDELTSELVLHGDVLGLDIVSMTHVQHLGEKHPRSDIVPLDTTIFGIFFTSGTHGQPRRIEISHANVVATIRGVLERVPFFETDIYISLVPLPQLTSFVFELTLLTSGSKIVFFEGDPLIEIKRIRPTVLVTYPHFLESIVKHLKRRFEKMPVFLHRLLQKISHWNDMNMPPNATYYHWLNRITFGNLAGLLGGNLRVLVSEGAFLRPSTQKILESLLEFPVLQCYGSVISTGIACIQSADDMEVGYIGNPIKCCEVTLLGIPRISLGEFHGEICLKGTNVGKFLPSSYVRSGRIVSNPWVHTGDIGEWKPGRPIGFIDHMENMIELSTKKWVSSQHLEAIYNEYDDVISGIYVYGDSDSSYLVAIVYVDDPKLRILGKKVGMSKKANPEEISQNHAIKDYLLTILDNLAGMSSLPLDHHIKDIFVTRKSFENLNGLTRTHTLKRHVLKNYFETEIQEMYRK